jgi:hypothetical protein
MARLLGVEYLSPVIGTDQDVWLLVPNPDYPVTFEYNSDPDDLLWGLVADIAAERMPTLAIEKFRRDRSAAIVAQAKERSRVAIDAMKAHARVRNEQMMTETRGEE